MRTEQREYRSRKARKKEKRARKDAGQDEVSAAFKVRAGSVAPDLAAAALDEMHFEYTGLSTRSGHSRLL